MAKADLTVDLNIMDLEIARDMAADLKRAYELLTRVQKIITYEDEPAAFHGYYGLPHELANEIAIFLIKMRATNESVR